MEEKLKSAKVAIILEGMGVDYPLSRGLAGTDSTGTATIPYA